MARLVDAQVGEGYTRTFDLEVLEFTNLFWASMVRNTPGRSISCMTRYGEIFQEVFEI